MKVRSDARDPTGVEDYAVSQKMLPVDPDCKATRATPLRMVIEEMKL
jgi:hypothetical protein